MGSRSTLPRGLRTILILIDNEKTVGDYERLLEGKQFMEKLPPFRECLDILFELNYIFLKEKPKSRISGLSIFDKKPIETQRVEQSQPAPSVFEVPTVSDNTPIEIHSEEISFKSMVANLVELIEQNLSQQSWSLIMEVEALADFDGLQGYIQKLYTSYKKDLSREAYDKLQKMVSEIKALNGN